MGQQSRMHLLTNPPLCFFALGSAKEDGEWWDHAAHCAWAQIQQETRAPPRMSSDWHTLTLPNRATGCWESASRWLLRGWVSALPFRYCLPGTEALLWYGIFNAKTRKSLAKMTWDKWVTLCFLSLSTCVLSNEGQQCGERRRRVSPYSGSSSTPRLMRTGVTRGLLWV